MSHKEWNRLDTALARLIANRAFRAEQPEEWLAAVAQLQAQLEENITD